LQATAKGAGSDAKESKEQQKSEEIEPLRVLSVAWLVIPIGAVVAAGVCGFVLRAAKHQEQQVPGYTQAVVLHGRCCVLCRLQVATWMVHQLQLGMSALEPMSCRCFGSA
jgi:hypothetical protein